MENSSGRRPLDQVGPRAEDIELQFWQTRSHAIIVHSSVSADCVYKVVSQKKEKELYLEDSRRLVPHRRPYSRVPGNSGSSNSSKTHRRVMLRAPGNWCKQRNKVLQQITQNYPASGNWCEVLSHLLRKKSLNFKSTSELKEMHKMWS